MSLNPLTSVRLTETEIKEIDNLVKDGTYMNRADAVRDIIRDHLKKLRKEKLK